MIRLVELIVFLEVLEDKAIERIESGIKLSIHRSGDVLLNEFGLGLQQIELLNHDDESDKGSQTADAGADPMHHFQPGGYLTVIRGCTQRIEHESGSNAYHDAEHEDDQGMLHSSPHHIGNRRGVRVRCEFSYGANGRIQGVRDEESGAGIHKLIADC